MDVISTTTTAGPRPAAHGPRPADHAGDFARQVEQARVNLEKLAHKLVASTFLAPMLNRLQEDPLRSDLFGGGFAQDAFARKLNTQLADRMAGAMKLGVVGDITKRFEDRVLSDPQQIERLARMRIDAIG